MTGEDKKKLKKQDLKITFMGTGTSHGVPMIGCDCRVCTSKDSRDNRNRCCVKLEFDGRVVIIDTPPEFRLQCIANNLTSLDAILFTHSHADHIFGLDDTRRFSAINKNIIECFADEKTAKSLLKIFEYGFSLNAPAVSEQPKLRANIVTEPFDLFGHLVIPLEIYHGRETILGYRIGDFAYCTDCSGVPDRTLEKLRGLDTLVLGCLRYTPHPTHFNVEQAIDAAKLIGARQTLFTHIAHEISHSQLDTQLPDNIRIAYDGLELEL